MREEKGSMHGRIEVGNSNTAMSVEGRKGSGREKGKGKAAEKGKKTADERKRMIRGKKAMK